MTDYFCIELKNYFNHKLIAEENSTDKIKSKFNNFGIYTDGHEDGVFYNSNSLPNSLEQLKINNILFVFPDKSIDNHDNISCEGEIILTPNLSCTSIYFLGLSDSSNIKDKVKLTFLDGSSEEIDIFFYRWNKGDNFYLIDIVNEDCEVALESINDKVSKGYIYIYKSILKTNDKKLSSIELPINPCLHIFSITLKYLN